MNQKIWTSRHSGVRSLLLAVASAVSGLAAAQPAASETQPAKPETVSPELREQAEQYLRITRSDDREPKAMETAIVRYVGQPGTAYADRIVDLIGVVHIGERDYYKELEERFATYDRVLYELVAPEGTVVNKQAAGQPRGPLGAMQLGMKDMLNLDFQLEHINYEAKNFRHADMSPEEFAKDMADRGDSLLKMAFRMIGSGMATQAAAAPEASDTALLFALFAPDRSRRMKQIMASQFQDMEVATAAMADESGKSTIITERNAKAMRVLRDELDRVGSKNVAIFYGAGHLPDMASRLENNFQMQATKTEWLQAWDLQKN